MGTAKHIVDGKLTMTMQVPPSVQERIAALKDKTQADDTGTVIANALRLYEHAIKQHDAGVASLDLAAVFDGTQAEPDAGQLIDAAESYASAYDGDDRPAIKTDVMNAFYAGAEFSRSKV